MRGSSAVLIFTSGNVKKAAIVIEKINGNTAKRVNNPNTSKVEHPASQRIIITSDHLLPNPMGSGKVLSKDEKCMIFSMPCVNIITPTNSRKNRAAKSTSLSPVKKEEINLQTFTLQGFFFTDNSLCDRMFQTPYKKNGCLNTVKTAVTKIFAI